MDTYATLVNRKTVVQSTSTTYFAVDQHLFFSLMEAALECVAIDEDWYLGKYDDVAEAIRAGSVKSAAHHYRRFGYYEHRLPYPIDVAQDWYLEVYTDVRDGLQKKNFASAQAHFETVGFREGRLPYANFSLATTGTATAVRPQLSTVK